MVFYERDGTANSPNKTQLRVDIAVFEARARYDIEVVTTNTASAD